MVVLDDEVAEAKSAKKKLKKNKTGGKENSMGDLEAMIMAKRNNVASGFLSYMEKKYCDEGPADGEPDESAFEAATAGGKKRTIKATTKTQAKPNKRARTK